MKVTVRPTAELKATRRRHLLSRTVGGWLLIGGITVLSSCSADTVAEPATADRVEASPVLHLVQTDSTKHLALDAARPAIVVPVVKTVRFSTYDGSGEVVHPDVVSFREPWNGRRFWNALTPYPNSATRFENPSLFASDDGDNWSIPGATLNPLTTTTRGYLSDPDMMFEPQSNAMWLYFREVVNSRDARGKEQHVADNVWVMTSTDALRWSAPRRVATDSDRFVVSPTIARRDESDWRMYQVDAGRGGCSSKSTSVTVRTSHDGLAWTAPSAVAMRQPGYRPWHLDVQYVPSLDEYWALVAAYPESKSCMSTSLFLLRSADGVNWTSSPAPVLAAGEFAQFSAAVYRSTFSVDDDGSVTIWYSGARMTRRGTKKRPAQFAWGAAVSHTTVAKLLTRIRDSSRKATLQVVGTGTNSADWATIPP